MLWTIAALVSSYLIGSIPTAYLFVRFLKGADIRKVGSGNVGATNALRVLGKGPGVLVLLLDIFKGFAAVVFLGNYFVNKPGFLEGHNLLILMGLCCICGHNWTIFLQFKGGKGIATSFGVLLALSIQIHGLNIVMGLPWRRLRETPTNTLLGSGGLHRDNKYIKHLLTNELLCLQSSQLLAMGSGRR